MTGERPSFDPLRPAGNPSGLDAATLWEILAHNHELIADIDHRTLFRQIVIRSMAIFGADEGFLVVSEEGRSFFEVALDAAGRDVARPGERISRSVLARTLYGGEAILQRTGPEGQASASSAEMLGLAAIMSVPIRVAGTIRGALFLYTRRSERLFAATDLEALGAFAGQAAIALFIADLLATNRAIEARLDEANRRLERRLDQSEEIVVTIRSQLDERQRALEARYRMSEIIGPSAAMAPLFAALESATRTDLPVLLTGESGTGKDLAARAIHFNGRRKEGPFVVENCASIPEALLEAELFGHVRGSFSGAESDRPGLLQMADGGTLFLDEVGEMSTAMQSKLLRVLEDGRIRPVGAREAIAVDVRVLAATHRDLRAMVETGAFREDLFYRLHVFPIALPPLRQRIEDLPALVDHLLTRAVGEGVRPRIDPAVWALWDAYPWPGNVRELANEIARLVALRIEAVGPEHLPRRMRPDRGSTGPGDETLDLEAIEAATIARALARTGGHRLRTAGLLGISKATLWRKMRKYDLEGSS